MSFHKLFTVVSTACFLFMSCKDIGDLPAPGTLSATPSSVTIAVGQNSAQVTIGGGTPPYKRTILPNPAIVSSQWVDSTLALAVLTLTRASTATPAAPATTVTIMDNSPSPGNEVVVPITVR